MPDRIVVSFRGVAAAEGGAGDYLARALAIKKRAEALGATLCSWGARTVSFELGPDEVEEAISLAILAADDQGVPPSMRFAVGIAQGEMMPAAELGRMAVLSWGKPLLAAVSLAFVAAPGEVLVDAALPAALSGELVLAGIRRGVQDGRRVRGHRLDTRQPFRRGAAESVTRLRVPVLVDRGAALTLLSVPAGALGILRADRGAGGTRALVELGARALPGRALHVAPAGSGREPFGALRRALSRADAGAAPLPPRLEEALARLRAGEGVDPRTAVELLEARLAGDAPGLILVDDAAEVDPWTLEAIAGAVARRRAARAIVRLGADDPLPGALAGVLDGGTQRTVRLDPLAPVEAEDLVRALFGGAITPAAARRWARRGRGSPLAVREAVCEALEHGALRWIDEIAAPRGTAAGQGDGRRRAPTPGSAEAPPVDPRPPARRWVERRLAHAGAEARAALTALALLGGEAPDALVDDVVSAAASADASRARVAAVERALTGGGWATRPEPGLLALSSRTLRDALLAAIPPGERARWHAAAASALRQRAGALPLADAAWHAAQAGDRRGAAELATRAAHAAARALIESAEAELLAFAADQDAAGEAPPASGDAEASSSPPTYRMPLAALAEMLDAPHSGAAATPIPGSAGPRRRQDTLPDPPPLSAPPPSEALTPTPSPEPPTLTSSRDRGGAASPPEPMPRLALPDLDPLAATTKSPVLSPAVLGDHLTEMAKQALVRGDLEELARVLDELRRTGTHGELVERMSGIVALGRGSKAEALRQLQAAAEAEQPPGRRARALLAYAVALASTGRTAQALFAALTALARAREAEDPHGEVACARFLERLSTAAGYGEAARAWAEAAARVAP